MSTIEHQFLELQLALAGEYSIERELGRGGMGVVLLARDVQLDRHVAIKVLPPQLADDDARARFLREARTAAALSHPHIVPIHRVGEAAGFVYFVMTGVPHSAHARAAAREAKGCRASATVMHMGGVRPKRRNRCAVIVLTRLEGHRINVRSQYGLFPTASSREGDDRRWRPSDRVVRVVVGGYPPIA